MDGQIRRNRRAVAKFLKTNMLPPPRGRARDFGAFHSKPHETAKNPFRHAQNGFGGEAQVYAERDEYVHKVCRIGQYISPGRFMDRLIIENTICPAAALTIEGFG